MLGAGVKLQFGRSIMDLTRAKAFAAVEIALSHLAARQREPNAWEEANLLEALIAITSRDYDAANTRIAAVARQPTPAEVSALVRRELLSRAEILNHFEDLRAEQTATYGGSVGRKSGGGLSRRTFLPTLPH